VDIDGLNGPVELKKAHISLANIVLGGEWALIERGRSREKRFGFEAKPLFNWVKYLVIPVL
jgi:hypothetical protein